MLNIPVLTYNEHMTVETHCDPCLQMQIKFTNTTRAALIQTEVSDTLQWCPGPAATEIRCA